MGLDVLAAQAADYNGISVAAAAGLIVCAVRNSETGQKLLSTFGLNASGDAVNTQALRPQLATFSAGERAEMTRALCNV